MCLVWLCVSVFLQACGVLWFLNILCVVCFGVLCICIDDYMHELQPTQHNKYSLAPEDGRINV